jgi:hypothetical protein
MKNPRSNRSVFAIIFAIGIVATLGLSQLYTAVLVPAFAPPPTLDQLYTQAIEDAMIAHPNEISYNLTPIIENNTNLVWQGTGENASVLMVTWTKHIESYPVGQNVSTNWGDTWVTAAPEIQAFFRDHVPADANLSLRAAELLGMPANTTNAYFVEFWVKPQDMFRPAPDNEISDASTQLTFPASASADYKAWFSNNIIYSYYPIKYPWTRLGYTYDWGSNNHIGLSEFIVKQYSIVTVQSVTPTLEYLQRLP